MSSEVQNLTDELGSLHVGLHQHSSIAYPTATLELNLQCRDLVSRASKRGQSVGASWCCSLSVPATDEDVAKVMQKTWADWKELASTEVVSNTQSPAFVKRFRVDFYFGKEQPLLFRVKHANTGAELGTARCAIGDIVACRGSSCVLPIHSEKDKGRRACGKLVIVAEDVVHVNSQVRMQLRATNLDAKTKLHKSNPFLVIQRESHFEPGEDGADERRWQPVYRSRTYRHTLNVDFEPLSMSAQQLCNGDYRRALRFDVMHERASGDAELIGSAERTLAELQDDWQHERHAHSLVNMDKLWRRKQHNKSYNDSGTLRLCAFAVEQRPSFVELLHAGLLIDVVLAIDFTSSNGPPEHPKSLHNVTKSEYERAFTDVLAVLRPYVGMERGIGLLGFGGAVAPDLEHVSHCFPLQRDGAVRVKVSSGETAASSVAEVYRDALTRVALSGPTHFTDIIEHVSRAVKTQAEANARTNQHQHTILVIFADGVIDDEERCVDAIVRASSLPLSIVIVGIGHADFCRMNVLDADDRPLVSTLSGERMKHDIVQFVPYERVRHNRSALARDVLYEIPRQVLDYVQDSGWQPTPRQVSMAYTAGVGGGGGGRGGGGGGTPVYLAPPVDGVQSVAMSIGDAPVDGDYDASLAQHAAELSFTVVPVNQPQVTDELTLPSVPTASSTTEAVDFPDVPDIPDAPDFFDDDDDGGGAAVAGGMGGGDRCKVCNERELNCVLMPCGHAICCSVCATSASTCMVLECSARIERFLLTK